MDSHNNKACDTARLVKLASVWQKKISRIQHRATLFPHQHQTLFRRFTTLHRGLSAQPRKTRRQLARKSRMQLTDIAFLLALGFSLPAEAVDILVDINIPDPVPDGSCSLIEAINNANADSLIHRDCPAGAGDDTIILQSGSTHTITKSINRRPDQGLTAITSRMTIEGNDSTINVSAVPVDIVFNIGSKGDLTLNDTIISGDTGSGSGTNGPRILNTGVLQLNNVQVLLNADRVSAITNASRGTLHANGLEVDFPDKFQIAGPTGNGIVNQGSMTLANTRVSNLDLGSGYYNGGKDAVYNSGSMTLNNIVIENNSSIYYGENSGIVNTGHLSGTDVTVSRNYSLLGYCGIVNMPGATLRLEDSLVTGGYSSPSGSYRYCTQFRNEGTAYLNGVTNISGYDLVNSGRMVIADSQFDGFNSSGDLELNSSTISGGTAVFIGNKATITNSTITGNSNVYYGRYDIYGFDSAVEFRGDITITNSTLGGNSLIAASDYLFSGVSRVTGILFDGNVSLTNSVITGSVLWEQLDTPYVPVYNAFINTGVLTSHNNLIGDSSLSNAEAFTGFTPGPTDITATSDGTDPTPLAEILDTETDWTGQLIPRLANNGGPTPTVALVAGSPAIDAADDTACPSTDQRGASRPQGTGCDIGAYEFDGGPSAVPPVTAADVISANHIWTTVSVDDMPGSPVVIAGPPTFNGGDPGVVRLRNVGASGFDIRFQEWDYRDGKHTQEQIPYLVAQPGRHAIPDGSIWEVGTFSHFGTPNWNTQAFTESFPGVPRLFLTVQTFNGGSAITARARNVSESGFQVGFFEQESLMDGHVGETVGYLAIYSPSGTGSIEIDGVPVDYDIQQTSANHNWTAVLDRQIKVEEEQSKDAETWHAFEAIDVMDLGGSLFGQIVSSNGGDPACLRQRE